MIEIADRIWPLLLLPGRRAEEHPDHPPRPGPCAPAIIKEFIMPGLLTNRIAVVQLTGMAMAALAASNILLPPGFDETRATAAVLMTGSAVSAIMRFRHPGNAEGEAKAWWQSRTIWTQIVGGGCAVLALAGVVPGPDQTTLVDLCMAAVGVVSMLLGRAGHRRIKSSGSGIAGMVAIIGVIGALLMTGGCDIASGHSAPSVAARLAERGMEVDLTLLRRRVEAGAVSSDIAAMQALRRLEDKYAASKLARATLDASGRHEARTDLVVVRAETDRNYAELRARLQVLGRE